MARACAVCHNNLSEWIWQPLGPGEGCKVFTLPGSHYRGFPTVPVCNSCRLRILDGASAPFVHRHVVYTLNRASGQFEAGPF